MKRYLEPQVRQDLKRKMVFIDGPRQVGKTTLARNLLGKSAGAILNWDVPAQRALILKQTFPKSRLWVFDEIHQYRRWRDCLKGVSDARDPRQQILVTGSARLDSMQVVRPRREPRSALPQGTLPGRGRLAGIRQWHERVRLARRDSGCAGAGASQDSGLVEPAAPLALAHVAHRGIQRAVLTFLAIAFHGVHHGLRHRV